MSDGVTELVSSSLRELIYRFLSLFGQGFSDRRFPVRLLLRHVFLQKLFRINSHVPRLVHWTSVIKAVDKIKRGTNNPGLSMGYFWMAATVLSFARMYG